MKKTVTSRRDSDGDATSTTATSSYASSTDPDALRFGRLSFDAAESLSLIKPHRSSDSAFEAIVSASSRADKGLSFKDFRLVRRIGSGDIGTVYLCRLRDDDACEYAMKVVDREAVALKNKTQRAETEKVILKMLDHPFLPTLYAEFNVSNFSCIVMEYCPGGDLHSLRHRQPSHRFSLSSARFYAAEVLVALEYLHMLGIIYRDLKPENVLVRSDGHIMLSDFDLSLCSDSIPAVQFPSYSASPDPTAHDLPPSPKNQFSCLPSPNRFFRSRKIETLAANRLFVAEPVAARSGSFVGTHEYVPPEVASGGSHGNAVDWWALGIFIYEMVYGRTPFAGPSNEATLRNILKKPLAFPTPTASSASEAHARALISGLLNKDPANRVGSRRGAAEIKIHPFFKGLNFALVRSLTPPAIPETRRHSSPAAPTTSFKGRKESTAFDLF